MGVSLNHLVLGSPEVTPAPGKGRKPSWLKMKLPGGGEVSLYQPRHAVALGKH